MSRFDEIREKFLEEAKGRTDSRSIYELRKKYLDRKAGEVNALMKEMRNIPKDEKADFGKNVNLLKDWVLENLTKMEEKAREAELQRRYESEKIDVTIPADKDPRGNLHPITQMKNQMVNIFAGMGFEIYEGSEIENDYYNFTALNTPMDHSEHPHGSSGKRHAGYFLPVSRVSAQDPDFRRTDPRDGGQEAPDQDPVPRQGFPLR